MNVTWVEDWRVCPSQMLLIGDKITESSNIIPVKTKELQFDNFVVTGGTVSCHYNNLVRNLKGAPGLIIPPLHRRWNGGILDSPRCLYVRLSVRPSVRRQCFRNFLKKLLAQLISYLAFALMGWVSWPLYIFVFLASFSALLWPNIWLKKGFLELFQKTIGSINFIPDIYPYGVSLLIPIHFRVPSLIFWSSGGQIFGRKWGFRNFLKKLLTQFIS